MVISTKIQTNYRIVNMNSHFALLTCILLFTCSALTAETDTKSLEEIRKLEKAQQVNEAYLAASSLGYPMSTITKIYLKVNISCKNEDKNRYKTFENTIQTNLIEKFKRHGINVLCANSINHIFLESFAGRLCISLELLPHGRVQYTQEGSIYSSYLFLAHMKLFQKAFFESRDLDASNYRIINNPFCTTELKAVYGIDQDPIIYFRGVADEWVDDFITDYKRSRSNAKE